MLNSKVENINFFFSRGVIGMFKVKVSFDAQKVLLVRNG